MFAGTQNLPPGTGAVSENGELKIRRYWKCEFPDQTDPRGDEELAAELWKRVKEATEARLMSDGPVGVFLSGGLDSSSIAPQLIALRKERGEGGVNSLSVGYLAHDGSSERDPP